MGMEGVEVQYFKQQLEAGIRDILEAQRLIASSRIYQRGYGRLTEKRGGAAVRGRSGKLMKALTNPSYRIFPDGGGVRAETTLPTYIRLLDMRRHGNFRIYNRQIWGILYNETLRDVKYGYGDWLRKNFPELLEQINNQSK